MGCLLMIVGLIVAYGAATTFDSVTVGFGLLILGVLWPSDCSREHK